MHCERRKRAHTAGAQPSSPCDASTRPTDAPQALRREKTKGSEPHAMRELERGREGKRARGKEKERERASVREASGALPLLVVVAVTPLWPHPAQSQTGRRRRDGETMGTARHTRDAAAKTRSGAPVEHLI